MKIKVNTNEVVTAGEKIIKLSEEIDFLLEDMFKDINNLFTKGFWQGISANKYQESIKKDPEELKKFCEVLKNYGTILVNSGESLNTIAKGYKINDKNIY